MFYMNKLTFPYSKKKSMILFGGLLVVITIFAATSTSFAADDVEDKQEELEELQKKEEKYRKLIDIKAQETTTIKSQVSSLESQSKKIENEITEAQKEVSQVTDKIQETENSITEKERAIEAQSALLGRVLRNKYARNLSTETLIENFGTNDLSFFGGEDRIAQTSFGVSKIVRLIIGERNALDRDKELLNSTKSEIAQAKNNLEKKNIQLETTKSQKELLALQTASEKVKYEDRLDKVLEEQLEIQQEIDSLNTTTIGSFSLGELPSKNGADMARPVKAPYVVTQGYGRTSFSHHYRGGNHNGVDYVARGNTDIMSAGDGTVRATGNMGRYGYGKWVTIDHGNGLTSLYGHLSSISVSKGASVDRGDKIGRQGTTGFSTGNHLHFTLFASPTFQIVPSSSVGGVYIPVGGTVNPALYF